MTRAECAWDYYFANQHSSRRGELVRHVNRSLLISASASDIDCSGHIQELEGCACFAADADLNRGANDDPSCGCNRAGLGYRYSLIYTITSSALSRRPRENMGTT